MAITPSDFLKIWASNADTPEYTFSEADYLKGWDFVGNLPPTRAQWNAMQKSTDEKMKYVFANFGAPLTASTVAGMTMQNRVYVYTGSETGYTAGHWYYWSGSAWTDGGVYNSNTVQVDPTLTISGAAADAETTGVIFDNLLYNARNIVLPGSIGGFFNVTADSSNYIVSGTQNVVELLSLWQGTKTFNGVTITVNGNTVTVNGVATADFNYSFSDGTSKPASQLALMDLGLPVINNKYTLSTKTISSASTTTVPAVCVRSKVSGNVVASQNNTAQFTMNTSTCGGLYIAINNNKTYNLTFVLAIFPYETTNGDKYREQTSDVTVFDRSGRFSLLGYTWMVGSPDIKEMHVRYKQKCLCLYSNRTVDYADMTECLDIYIPMNNGYINYVMGHCVSTLNNADLWRLVQVDYVNSGLGLEHHITQQGETEMALKIDGRDDFVGGRTHGDELFISSTLRIAVDGRMVDFGDLSVITEFDDLQIFQTTRMYDPADHTTFIGNHEECWKFDLNGMEINQNIKFASDLTLGGSYVPMLCVLRGNDSAIGLQITDTYIDNGNFTPYDVSVAGFTTYPTQLKNDVTQIYLYGAPTGVRCELEITEQPKGLNGEGTFLYNGEGYNKVFCCVCGYNNTASNLQHVVAGDIWRFKTKFKITKN